MIIVTFCLAVWVCFKQGSENMVMVVLLQIGAKDLTVWIPGPPPPGIQPRLTVICTAALAGRACSSWPAYYCMQLLLQWVTLTDTSHFVYTVVILVYLFLLSSMGWRKKTSVKSPTVSSHHSKSFLPDSLPLLSKLLHEIRILSHLLRLMELALAPKQSEYKGLYCWTVGGQWN